MGQSSPCSRVDDAVMEVCKVSISVPVIPTASLMSCSCVTHRAFQHLLLARYTMLVREESKGQQSLHI